jgi:hypothetical protein
MKLLTLNRGVSGAVFLGALAWAPVSLAQLTVAAPPTGTTIVTAQPGVAEQTSYSAPNRVIVASGAGAFVGAYVPAILVAAVSGASYDNNLYIPLAGPWLDLANRPPCGGLGQQVCSTENGYRAMLIASGVFQGLGALATGVGLLTPERHTVRVTAKADAPAKANLHVAPSPVGHGGYGVTAFGDF